MSRYQRPCSECGSRTVNPSCIACTYHPNDNEDRTIRDQIRCDTREAREWTDHRTTSEIRRDLSLLGVRVLDNNNPNTSRSYAGAVSVLIGVLAIIALVVTLLK
jgi:hypothetical protein